MNEGKLSYSKIYEQNMNYITPMEDIWGNETKVDINITEIDDKAPEIAINYEYNVEENKVTVIMHSNEILGNTKPTWTLSEDKLTYTKLYNALINEDYATPVQDIYGNESWTKIRIKTKEYCYNNNGFDINVKYLYDSNDNVTVYIISNKLLKDTKPTWKLDETQTVYSKAFTGNISYLTDVVDINGNQTSVSIIIDFFKNTYKGIDISEYQKIINWRTVKDSGIDFAIIRVGYRGYRAGTIVEDRFFERNIIEATRVRNGYRSIFL